MKIKFGKFLSLLLFGSIIFGASHLTWEIKPFIGDWEGQILIGGEIFDCICHFEADGEGALKGTIDAPSEGAYGFALGDIKPEARTLFFRIADPGVPGEPFFEGELSVDGTVLSGTFTQGGQEGTFEIKKK